MALGYDTRVLEQGDEASAPGTAHNVVAELRGTRRPSEVVLIAAHADAFYAGADDNSSGVAAMLEVARVAASHRFVRTVRFVGFDLEERGNVGSTRYVEAGLARDVAAALILECVGFTDKRKGSQNSPPGLQLGDVGDSLVIAANEDSRHLAQRMLAINHALNLIELRAVIAGGQGAAFFTGALLRSDNGPFWLRAVPALMLTDTADYRNPNYHRASDTPHTLDPEFLAGSTRLVAASLAIFAELEP
jgi:Zn-dependent M28 family amino/carboxypeptidase